MTLLVAEDLTIRARLGARSVEVIRDLSFALPPGRILGLVGESGAGKSMVGRVIARELPAGFAVAAGRLRFGELDLVHAPRPRLRAMLGREIAFVPQEPMTSLNPVMTIGAQFGEHLWRLGIPRRARRERMRSLFDAVHLPDAEEVLRRYPHQLSGGMCQRVLIAMAFASRPRLVVADEPTTALDVTIQARIVQLIAEMQRREGTALVFITHDLRLAARICDEIVVLYAGRPVERGPARALLSHPAHPYTHCLQLASPPMSGAIRPLHVLPEQMPGLAEQAPMTGCRFAPRCPSVQPDCRTVEPPAAERTDGRVVACLHPGSAIRAATARVLAGDALAGAPVLRTEKLGKCFVVHRGWLRHRREIAAVRDATFQVGAGEFVGLVGESGSGKSTLARLIVGLEPPSAGHIMLGGQDVSRKIRAARRHRLAWVQMVFQDPQSALNPRRRVADIVTQSLEARGSRTRASRLEREERARALLKEVGLAPELANRHPAALSGGQRQRVNIARALYAVPRLLIADEIVSGLDVSVQAQLIELLQRLRAERGIAMLFISHDLSVVRHLCERVLVMHRGEIVEQGRTEEVFAEPRHPYTRRLLAAVPPDDLNQPWRPFPEETERQAAE